MTNPTVITDPNPNPTPSDGEATPQPTPEERLKALEAAGVEKDAKYEAAVREMNDKQRRAAQLESELESQRLESSTYRNQLAKFQVQADPLAEAKKQMLAFQEAGEIGRASEIQAQIAAHQSNESLRQVAMVSLTNQLAALEMNPGISEDAKRIIREQAFVDPNNPDRGLRDDNLNDLMMLAVKPLGFKKLVDQSEERALGRRVRSGEWEKEFTVKAQENERKRKEDIARQSSLTSSGDQVPPVPPTGEQVKERNRKTIDDILKAEPPVL